MIDDKKIMVETHNFMAMWSGRQDDRIRPQLGLFIFPQCVSMGFTLIEESVQFTTNKKLIKILTKVSGWEQAVINDIAEMTVQRNLDVDGSYFKDSSQMNCFFDAINEELTCDFMEWFKERFDTEFAEAIQDDPTENVFKMLAIGLSAISSGFYYLSLIAPDDTEFSNELQEYYHRLCDQIKTLVNQA